MIPAVYSPESQMSCPDKVEIRKQATGTMNDVLHNQRNILSGNAHKTMVYFVSLTSLPQQRQRLISGGAADFTIGFRQLNVKATVQREDMNEQST